MVECLYQMCLSKITKMLLTNYLRTDASPNPFLFYPPSVVSDLIRRICQNAVGRLKSSYLHLLLTSGRVQDFTLNDVILESKDAEDIFHDLQSSAEIIKSITIENVSLEGSDILWNLGRLIRLSKSLTSVETCIDFPISELFYSESLKDLTLNYVIRNRLKSYSELRSLPHYNNSLRVLKIFKAQASPKLHEVIGDIMQYCLELIAIEFDVTETLEYLYKKNKSQKYKLQRTFLGSNFSCFTKRANENAILIASAVCPDLQSVEITPVNYGCIHALNNFHHITDLVLTRPILSIIDYRNGVHPLLETPHFGTHLKSLTLYKFSKVDFTSIGICCPNLEVLKVDYSSVDNALNLPQNAFQKLVKLDLIKFLNGPCEVSTMCTILPNASALKDLNINDASELTDDVLDEILEHKGVLSKLKHLYLADCGLTVKGLEKLKRRAESLNDVYISSSSITGKEARRVLYNTEKFDFFELNENNH